MQKTRKYETKQIKNTILFLDDIVDIYEAVSENSDNARIELNGFSLDSISEIYQFKNKRIESFGICAANHDVSVSYENRLYIHYSDDTASLGIVKRIEDIVKRGHSRFSAFLWSGWSFAVVTVVLLFASSALSVYHQVETGKYSYIPAIILIPYAIKLFFKPDNGNIKINPYNRSESSNFFSRNWEQLLLNIIVLIVGFILGKLI